MFVAVSAFGAAQTGISVNDTLSIEISPSNVPALVPLNVIDIV